MSFGIMTIPLTYFFDLGLHISAYIIIYFNYLSNYLSQNSLVTNNFFFQSKSLKPFSEEIYFILQTNVICTFLCYKQFCNYVFKQNIFLKII